MKNIIVENIFLVQELSKYPPEQIHQVLRSESPQIISVILSRLDSRISSKVLNQFSLEEQKDLMHRMSTAINVPAEALHSALKIITDNIKVFKDEEGTIIDGSQKLAKILSSMPPDKGKEILERLKNKDQNLASKIQEKMFDFDDIEKIEDKSLRELLTEVKINTLAMALKGTNTDFKKKVFKNMSINKQRILKEEMEYLGPQRKSEVEKARKELLDLIRKKHKMGQILFDTDIDTDEWIE